MKKPRFKAGQFVVLPKGHVFPGHPQILPEQLYTIDHHIWNGADWYVTLTKFGSLTALKESAFRSATKSEQSLPF